MNITKEDMKNILKNIMNEESEYQTFFRKALEKTGKSIPEMSDDEKKEFFNKINASWESRGEKNELNNNDELNEFVPFVPTMGPVQPSGNKYVYIIQLMLLIVAGVINAAPIVLGAIPDWIKETARRYKLDKNSTKQETRKIAEAMYSKITAREKSVLSKYVNKMFKGSDKDTRVRGADQTNRYMDKLKRRYKMESISSYVNKNIINERQETGLNVYPKTPSDFKKLTKWLDLPSSPFGIIDDRKGLIFFPEKTYSMFDLEDKLHKEFSKAKISVRFKSIWEGFTNETLSSYDYTTLAEGLWPKSKLSDAFQFLLAGELKKNFKGIFYVIGYDLYHNDNKVMRIDTDKDSVQSIIKSLKSKIKESVNEGRKSKDSAGVRYVEAIYNNSFDIVGLVMDEKKDVKEVVDIMGPVLINAIKAAITHNYKPNPQPAYTLKRDLQRFGDLSNQQRIDVFKKGLKELLAVVTELVKRPSKAGIKRLEERFRKFWNSEYGANIGLSGTGSHANTIIESVNESKLKPGTKLRYEKNNFVIDYVVDKEYTRRDGFTNYILKVVKSNYPKKVKVGSTEEYEDSKLTGLIRNRVMNFIKNESITKSLTENFIPKVGTIDDFMLKDLLLKNPKVKEILSNKELEFLKKSNTDVIKHQSKRFNTIVTDGKLEFEIDLKVGKLVKPIGKARREIVNYYSTNEGKSKKAVLSMSEEAGIVEANCGCGGVKTSNTYPLSEFTISESKYDSMLDKLANIVDGVSFMNIGRELKKNGIKYSFSTSMIPMYKIDKLPIAIVNKKYAAGAEREVGDIAIGLLENKTIKESTYVIGKDEYTKRNLTPTQILDLAMTYANKSATISNMYGKNMTKMVSVANDLAKLTGTKQMDAKARGNTPALLLTLLKNELVTKDEYVKLYKNLLETQISVIKALKKADPAAKLSGGTAARAAARDMKGEFDESVYRSNANNVGGKTNFVKRGNTIIEGRAFINAARKAKEEGKTEFEFNGKTYPVTIK
jgi:hypothetical protein